MIKRNLLIALGLLLIITAFSGIRSALAKPEPAPIKQTSPLHPTFALLDESGKNVLETGAAVSTMKTCGQCHDTEFIQSHTFHSDLGLSAYTRDRELNSSNGMFGEWDPLTYRFLSQKGDERLDLSTAEWLELNGARVVGGGPATTSRERTPLTSLKADPNDPEASILNKDGKAEAWDWNAWGTMEMNCFLCHLESPNNQLRVATIKNGDFGDANTATLIGTGIVSDKTTDLWAYNPEAFDENGKLKSDFVKIQDPTNANCAACHGEVHTNNDQPLTISAYDLTNPQTATTGQVISAQRISDSGLNIRGKDELTRSWDIHAERQLQCTDCHYALNNPAHADEAQKAEPDHLLYDPRVLDVGEYLKKPDHNFARGQSAQFNVAPEYKGTMRRCENCHDANKSHANWLPYIDTHMAAVACETCHIPQMYAPAIQSYDWTVLTLDKQPVKVYRGVGGNPNEVTSLITGYKPVLLNRTNIDGRELLAPYNLITTYYWVYDDINGNKRPVRLFDLETAYFENGTYAVDILSAFDVNHDGSLAKDELVIDSSAKEEAVKTKLESLGLNDPRIEGLTQPYSINHNVARGENAVNDCKTCHDDASRVSQPIKLANYSPNGILPVFDPTNNVNASGEIVKGADGAVYYNPVPAKDKMYVFGSSRLNWIDWLGSLLFVGSLLGVVGHGTLRFLSSRKQAKGPARTEQIYMYEAYRRFWHWLQTVAIVILLFTGLIIHRPDIFGAFSFRGVVTVHNVIAVILVVNALLSVFYHIATERMQEYIPRPYGFFDDAIVQAKYYISGIFKGEGHPFEKRPDSRMNPIQKATYFGILMVLLPLQILTGALMWSVQKFPAVANWFGGLPFLAPFHSLIAWTFATFIIVHVYMTTTGTTPLEATRAMITGYEKVEMHAHDQGEQK
ncbi:MAG TPA: cytochrome b/b6 domain-containing protein [Anaerolineales bacterium]|nr:cytochrome b/b6 domain-containing protein [Anaerolineales bacterium]